MSTAGLPYIRSHHRRPRRDSIESLTSNYSNNSFASASTSRSLRSYKSYSSVKSHATFNSRGSFSSHASDSSRSSLDSQDTCVVSRLKDNTPLEDMASFCKQNMVVGSLWECRAFTSDLPDLPDSILFLTFSIKDLENAPAYGAGLNESSMTW